MALEFFLRMLLGHLIGDFMLQPYKIALAKRAGWRGLLLHVSIVTISTSIAIYQITPKWFIWTIILFVVHLFIDQFRTFIFTDNSKGKSLYFFILDQLVHIISIMLISWFAAGWRFSSLAPIFDQTLTPLNTLLLSLCLTVVAIWVVPILEVELVGAIMAQRMTAKKELIPILRADRVMGAIERLFSVILIVLSNGLLIPLVFLPRLYWLLHKDTTPNKIAIYSKTGTSFVTALAISLPLWLIPFI